MKKICLAAAVLLYCILFFTVPVFGETVSGSLTEELLNELDTKELEEYLEEENTPLDLTFSELVEELIYGEGFDWEQILNWIMEKLLGELAENRGFMTEVLVLAFAFAFLKSFTDISSNAYVSEISFVLVYGVLMALLVQSFTLVHNILENVLVKVTDFMKALAPVFGMTLVFSAQGSTAAGFYELIYILIFLIECVILNVMLPALKIYIVIQFVNYILEGEKFSKLSELLEAVFNWILKFMTGAVVGINMIQGMLKPSLDRLKNSAITKTVSMIPGIGGAVNSAGEIFLSTGMVIKNGVGIAGILILIVLAAFPFIRLAVMTVCYKFAAAILEPVSDKRISGCINGVYKGSVLALKMLITVFLLFFITIAMIAASTSWSS